MLKLQCGLPNGSADSGWWVTDRLNLAGESESAESLSKDLFLQWTYQQTG
jgi:hypothetical protein